MGGDEAEVTRLVAAKADADDVRGDGAAVGTTEELAGDQLAFDLRGG